MSILTTTYRFYFSAGFSRGQGLSLAVTVLGWSGEYYDTPTGDIATALKSFCSQLSAKFGWK